MNKFKNYILMAAGFAIVAAIVSGITAAPAIAALVKAALVQNVDEPGRSPLLLSDSFGGGTCDANNCFQTVSFSAPAANTRFVIKDVSAKAYLAPGTKVSFAVLFSCPTLNTVCSAPTAGSSIPAIAVPMTLQAASVKVPFSPTLTTDVWEIHQAVDFYVEAGSNPSIGFVLDSGAFTGSFPFIRGTVSGYTVALP